jgi:hypothetical protein
MNCSWAYNNTFRGVTRYLKIINKIINKLKIPFNFQFATKNEEKLFILIIIISLIESIIIEAT